MLCRIICNNIDKKVLPKLISDFEANNSYSCRQITICDKKDCPSVKKHNIISIVVRETMFLCLKIVELNKLCIDTDFIKHVFKVYKKGRDYSCRNL